MIPHGRPWILGLLLAVLGVSALLGPGHHALLPCQGGASACRSEEDRDQGVVLTTVADDCPFCDLQAHQVSLDATPPVVFEPVSAETFLHDVPLALLPLPRTLSAPRAPPLAI